MGPVLGVRHLLDPREGKFTAQSDVALVQPVLEAISDEYLAYELSGSLAWSATLNVSNRPGWLVTLAHRCEAGAVPGKYTQVTPAPSDPEDDLREITDEGGLVHTETLDAPKEPPTEKAREKVCETAVEDIEP